jgi:hypothetical protein
MLFFKNPIFNIGSYFSRKQSDNIWRKANPQAQATNLPKAYWREANGTTDNQRIGLYRTSTPDIGR